jgi:hypothetical protein
MRFNAPPPRHPRVQNTPSKMGESSLWDGVQQAQQQQTQGPFSENQVWHQENVSDGIISQTLAASSVVRKCSKNSSAATEMHSRGVDEEEDIVDADYDDNDTMGEDAIGSNGQQIPGMYELNARHPMTWNVGDVQLWLRSIGISLPIVEIFGGMMHL